MKTQTCVVSLYHTLPRFSFDNKQCIFYKPPLCYFQRENISLSSPTRDHDAALTDTSTEFLCIYFYLNACIFIHSKTPLPSYKTISLQE